MGSTQAQNIKVSGHVRDSNTGEPLIGAGVRCGESGVATNSYGYYSITVPTGKTTLVYTYVGHSDSSESFTALRDTVINVSLEDSEVLDEVSVSARKGTGINSTYLGAIDIPVEQIRRTPTVLGENDVLKTIQLLPGVQAGTSGFTGLYVRGGSSEENLLLLDGVPLYNADHLLGLFSIFMPESVKKVTLYKGSFPARYGGRVSSIVDVRTNDGNTESVRGSVSIGLITSKAHVEGPIDSRTTFSLSGRLMHTAVLQPFVRFLNEEDRYNYYLYDINAKLSRTFGDNDRMFLNLYQGRDHVMGSDVENERRNDEDGSYDNNLVSESKIRWGNTLASLRWNHIWNRGLFSNVTVAYNRYSMITKAKSTDTDKYPSGEETKVKTNVDYRSGIHDVSAFLDFDWSAAPGNVVKFGAGYIFHTFRPETMGTKEIEMNGETIVSDTSYKETTATVIHGHELSFYGEDEISIGGRFSANIGVRAALFKAKGKIWPSFEPRIAARYSFGSGFAAKAGYSRMAQGIHLLTSTQISLPMDLWVPVTENIKPVVSDTYSMGVFKETDSGWEVSIEGYFRSMDNVLEYKDGVVMLGGTASWQDKVVMGKGRAYGIELFIQKTKGRTTGWVAYTLAKSERRFPDGSISRGNWYPYKYDRRHQVNLVVNQKFSDRIDLTGTWTFATGGVLTVPQRRIYALAPDGSTYIMADETESRGNYRLSSSHRLDIGVNFRKAKRHGERVWTIGCYNLYNSKSPDFAYRDDDEISSSSSQTRTTRLKMYTLLPVLPYFSYTFNF
jgi:outer membrane cobalamin receptor